MDDISVPRKDGWLRPLLISLALIALLAGSIVLFMFAVEPSAGAAGGCGGG